MGEFRQLDEQLIYQGHVMAVVKGTFETPDGGRFTRDIIRHPGAVGVVPVLRAGPAPGAAAGGSAALTVLMVRQYRPVFDAPLLEIPAGTRDVAGESPEATARRELAEEIGATAEHLHHLATYAVAPGVSDEQMHLYLATGLTLGDSQADGPEEQHMTTEQIRLADTPELIASGRISDAKSIIGLLLAQAQLADVGDLGDVGS